LKTKDTGVKMDGITARGKTEEEEEEDFAYVEKGLVVIEGF
jgi:hypothetical protein